MKNPTISLSDARDLVVAALAANRTRDDNARSVAFSIIEDDFHVRHASP